MKVVCAIAPLFVVVTACSSSDLAPRAGVTLLVTNETCTGGTCRPLEVIAFPNIQTRTPGGPVTIDLGSLTAQQQCFTLPTSLQFRIFDQASGEVDIIDWSDAQGLSLAALPPNTPLAQASPTTRAFVPAAAGGWRISLPSGNAVRFAPACSSGRGPT